MKIFIKIMSAIMCFLSVCLIFTSCAEQKTEDEKTEDGVMSSFSAEDINGNPVTQDIFKDYKITMINFWGTFCGPCISEMPDLGEISKEYKDKGVAVVGIPVDVAVDGGASVDSNLVADAREIIKETGADYTHILPSESLYAAKIKDVYSIPETIFVDSSGKQIGKSYIGAKSKEQWTAIIDELLEQVS